MAAFEMQISSYVEQCRIVYVINYVIRLLGLKELSPPNLNLLQIMQNETHASEPILFILSLGADPSQELQDLAKSTVGAEKYHQVFSVAISIRTLQHSATVSSA